MAETTGTPHDAPQEQRTAAENRRQTARRDVVDRRVSQSSSERRSDMERRRGPGRRRSDERRSAEEGEMTDEQFEFLQAVNEYKKINKRPFPTWTEVLDVIKALGYRKVANRQDVQ